MCEAVRKPRNAAWLMRRLRCGDLVAARFIEITRHAVAAAISDDVFSHELIEVRYFSAVVPPYVATCTRTRTFCFVGGFTFQVCSAIKYHTILETLFKLMHSCGIPLARRRAYRWPGDVHTAGQATCIPLARRCAYRWPGDVHMYVRGHGV